MKWRRRSGLDPVQFRLMHITRPKVGDTRYPYDSFPSVEVLERGRESVWMGQAKSSGGRERRVGSSADSASACRSIMAA